MIVAPDAGVIVVLPLQVNVEVGQVITLRHWELLSHLVTLLFSTLDKQRQFWTVRKQQHLMYSTLTAQYIIVKSLLMLSGVNILYLRSVENGRHWQHGDDDENVSTAAHVTWHDQHFRQSRIQRKLHHEPPSGCQSAWNRDEKKPSSNTGKSQKGLESTLFRKCWWWENDSTLRFWSNFFRSSDFKDYMTD